MAFGIGMSVFFAGFSPVSAIEVGCRWHDSSQTLQKVCNEAGKRQTSAKKWMSDYMKGFEIDESKDYFDKLKVAEKGVEKTKLDLNNIKNNIPIIPFTGQMIEGIFIPDEISASDQKKIEDYNKSYDKALADFKLAEDKLETIKDSRFADINDKIEEGKDRAERVFFEGYKIMVKISDDLNEENKNKGIFSKLELEKMFIEATDLFIYSEKLVRKPVIHSGGILPGPGIEEDGQSYLANKFLAKFVNGALVMLFSAGTLILIIGGLMFLVSSGDEEIKTKAKDTIFWGIIGIIIAVLAYAIVKFVVGLDFGF